MALATGASVFNEAVRPFAYWYEKRPYTWLDTALNPGPETLVDVAQIGELPRDPSLGGDGPLLARVTDVAMTPTSQVLLEARAGGTPHNLAGDAAVQSWNVAPIRTIPTETWPSGLIPNGARWSTPGNLLLSWQNNNASALNTTMQGAAGIALTPLPIGLQHQFGLPMAPNDQALWDQYGSEHFTPWDLQKLRRHVWDSAYLGDEVLGAVVTASGTTVPAIGPITVPKGQVVVLRAVAVGLPANSVGHLINLGVLRDSSAVLHQWWADNSAGLQYPFDCWMMARSRLSLQIGATTLTTGIALQIRLEHYTITPLLAALFGWAPPPQERAWAIAYAEAKLGGRLI